MTSWALAARVCIGRVTDRFAAVAPALACAAVWFTALLERDVTPERAADNVLLGMTFGIAVPLTIYALVSRVAGYGRLTRAYDVVARHGVNRRICSAAALAIAAVVAALIGAVLAALSVISARGFADPASLSDAFTSAWIGALSGFAYSGWFALGSTFGARGGGRLVLLGADWLLGAGERFGGALMPRGHVRNLLGAEAPMALSQPEATVALACLGCACVALAVWRTPP